MMKQDQAKDGICQVQFLWVLLFHRIQMDTYLHIIYPSLHIPQVILLPADVRDVHGAVHYSGRECGMM